MQSKSIQVPASTTNLGAGFDVLGLALKLFLRVEISEISDSRHQFFLGGEGSEDLPASEENLLWRVLKRVFEGEGLPVPTLRLKIENEIPIARGLGSSAAAIVAGIGCFEAVTGRELTSSEFFRYAFEFENHPDNLSAARYGGFTVSAVDEKGTIQLFRSEITPNFKILITVPEFHLKTVEARRAINKTVDLSDAVFNLQRSSLMVAAMLRGEIQYLKEAVRDRLHQPYRAPLIPGFEEILQLNENSVPGLIGLCLSGAGPSVLAFAEGNLDEIYQRIASIFAERGLRSRRFELQPDNGGRTIH